MSELPEPSRCSMSMLYVTGLNSLLLTETQRVINKARVLRPEHS